MPDKEGKFFVGLPSRKAIARTGYCEPEAGDIHNSVVVNIDESCVTCAFLVCHMFRTILDNDENIVGRVFTNHPPQY